MVAFSFEYIYGLSSKLEVKMTGCWSIIFFSSFWFEPKSVITTILTERAWSRKVLLHDIKQQKMIFVFGYFLN